MEAVTIKRSAVVEAKRQRVWQAITDPTQFSEWFGDKIHFERLAEGEPIRFFKDGHPGRIAVVDAPVRFAFYWPAEPGSSVESLVTFLLETTAEGTRITITEEGLEALPENMQRHRFDLNNKGWGIQLENIAKYLRKEANVRA
jgi:uncharacterized protein YndB with AHSA1/START domain